jgi:uncharacterized RDD family membrane protein YckC
LNPTDKLTIDTPEQIALELPLAGIGSRFLAIAFDTLLQFIVSFVALLLLAGVSAAAPSFLRFLSPTVAMAVMIIFLFCLYWGYFALFEIIWKGQTPGKRFAKIRVINENGRPINPIEAIGRNLMRVVDLLPGMYGVGIVTMMLNDRNRRLGDYVAGTVVVHDVPLQDFRPDWSMSRETVQSHSEATQLGSNELVIIETFLHRRLDLDPMIRLKTAEKIVEMVKAKTGLQPDAHQPDEDFLELVARQVRDAARFR